MLGNTRKDAIFMYFVCCVLCTIHTRPMQSFLSIQCSQPYTNTSYSFSFYFAVRSFIDSKLLNTCITMIHPFTLCMAAM